MASSRPPSTQRSHLSQDTRERFVADTGRALTEIYGAVQEKLSALVNEAAPSREMQVRRDAWTFYQRAKAQWRDGTLRGWQQAMLPASNFAKTDLQDIDALQLVGTDVVENKILASRLVLRVMDKVSTELDDLRLRIRYIENTADLERGDVLRPEVLVLVLVEQWAAAGMPSGSWPLINDVVQTLLSERLKQAYHKANQHLIEQGVMPVIELKDRVKRAAPTVSPPRPQAPRPQAPDQGPHSEYPDSAAGGHGGYPSGRGGGSQSYDGAISSRGGFRQDLGGRMSASGSAPFDGPQGGGWSADPGADMRGGPVAAGNRPGASGNQAGAHSQQGSQHDARQAPEMAGTANAQRHAAATQEETRMMTAATPLARARSRAQGVLGQLKRLLVGRVGPEFDATSYEQASPGLAAAIIARRAENAASYGASGTAYEDYSPAGVAVVAGRLRAQTIELKNKAETKGEKATIEIVALMFQSILQEERIPPGIRVWFARLQMPVLRVALAEPDFFGTASHPARQLIDRMGSCVMGFDASGIQGSALEKEIKRVVQVIEQYPETGKRVYELVYSEFQKFLQKFLAGSGLAQKVASVAQQVEQKETLTIQYTIEMRNTLKDLPVREEIRVFLFKVWAEVLAVAAVRKGPQHAETLELKKTATDLVWAASAKPNRSDRAKVIQDLPKLLQRLRSGMLLLGMAPSQQDIHVKTVSDTLADAFLSKTQAIPTAQIDAMAKRLANLEDFVSEDGMGDLPLDAESIELMLGIDPATIDVVANGGSKPTNAMLAWAQELELGSWYTLDHNGRITKVQFVWRSERKQLNLFASTDGHSYLIQAGRMAAYLQAGLLLPQEEEALTVRATRDALAKIEANPERLLG
ncbi:MAG: DUF1631 domain-containing protein [Rhodoferax sp.]|nr:DUF1631 domain-containing protein [Rhodoferax sp.]